MYIQSGSCICGTTDQFCYGGCTSGVFTDYFSVRGSVIVKLVYYCMFVAATASNYGMEIEASSQDLESHQLGCW